MHRNMRIFKISRNDIYDYQKDFLYVEKQKTIVFDPADDDAIIILIKSLIWEAPVDISAMMLFVEKR